MGPMGEYGRALESLGYHLVPERRRVPIQKGWNEGTYTYRPEHDGLDIGFVCGVGDTPVYAIDVDSNDVQFSHWLESWLRAHDGWDDMPVRVGRKPRFAALVSGAALGLRSTVSRMYKFPDTGNEVRIEFLGAGRKLTVYGTHAITGQPYSWRGGLAPHQGRAAMTLPEVDQEFVSAMLAAAHEWLERAGAQVLGHGGDGGGRFMSAGDGPSMAGLAPRQGLTMDRLRQALDAIDLGDRDTWVKVGMAVHHETEGSEEGFDAWHDRSLECAGYKSERDCRTVWESFGERDRPPITARYLLSLAREAASPQAIAKALQTSTGAVPQTSRDAAEPPASVLVATNAAVEQRTPKFQVYSPVELLARQANLSWLVKPILAERALSMVYGDSGVGKSFLVLDLACRLALGWEWFGHRVRQGTVLYIAAEGQSGIGRRLQAFGRHHNAELGAINVSTIVETPDLRSTDWIEIAERVRELQARYGNVVQGFIDTLAATTPGANENASEDMGAFLGHVRNLIQCTGVGFTIVHHAGKDSSKGARGHSSLRAACDSIIEVSRESMDSDVRKLKLVKSRDSADGSEWYVTLQDVDLDIDEDGDIIMSKVVVPADAPPQDSRKKVPKHAKWQQCVLVCAQGLQDHKGVVKFDELVVAAISSYYPQQSNGQHVQTDKNLRGAVRRACEGLAEKGLVELSFTPKLAIDSVKILSKK